MNSEPIHRRSPGRRAKSRDHRLRETSHTRHRSRSINNGIRMSWCVKIQYLTTTTPSRGAVPIGGTKKHQKPFFSEKRGAHPSRGTVVSGIPSRMTRNLCESLWYHIAAFCEMRAARASVKKESRGAVPIGGSKKHEKTIFRKNETRFLAEARRCDGFPRV